MSEITRGTVFSPKIDEGLQNARMYVAIEKRGSDWFVGALFGTLEMPEFRRHGGGGFGEKDVGKILGQLDEIEVQKMETIIKSL